MLPAMMTVIGHRPICLLPGWATNGLNTINGSHWFRKDFQVSGQQAGEKATFAWDAS